MKKTKGTVAAASVAAVAALLSTPGVALADDTAQQEPGVITQDQAEATLQAMSDVTTTVNEAVEPAPKSVEPGIPTDADIANAQHAVDNAQANVNAAQDGVDSAQADVNQAQSAKDEAQANKDTAGQAVSDAQQGVTDAQAGVDQAQKDKDAAEDHLQQVTEEGTDVTQDDVDAAQDALNEAQDKVDDAQAEADKADKAEADAQANDDAAKQAVTDADTGNKKAQADKTSTESAKADADQAVKDAQKAYDDAVNNHDGAVQQAAADLAEAKADQAAAKEDYADAAQAQKDAQDKLDKAREDLEKAQAAQDSQQGQASVSKGVLGLLESIINDPSATPARKADAQRAYKILAENSYKVNSNWWGWVDTADEDDATSFINMQNALTYYDAVNAIRRAHGVNELGVNLTAMATAMLNCTYSGEISFDHSGIRTGWENLAGGSGAYTGSNDPNDWEEAYNSGHAYGSDWPFTGWYTDEKHIYDKNPDAPYSSVGHYLNFIDPDVVSMGFGTGDGVTIWDGSRAAASYSASEFKALIGSYVEALNSGTAGGGDTIDLEAAQKAFDEAQKAYDEAKDTADKAKADIDAAQAALDAAQAKVDGLEDGSYIEGLEADLAAKKAAAEAAQTKLDEASKVASEAATEYTDAVAHQTETAAALAVAKTNTAEAHLALQMEKGILASAQEKLEALEAELNKIPNAQKALEEAIQKLADAQKALQDAQDAYTQAVEDQATANEVLTARLNALNEAQTALNEALGVLADAKDELSGAQDKLDALNAIIDSLQKDEAGTDTTTGVAGVQGTVQNVSFKTPEEEDATVEAAAKASMTVDKLAQTGGDVAGVAFVTVGALLAAAGVTVAKARRQTLKK